MNLLRKSKKDCFAKLNEKQVTYNKRFSKIVKPILLNKVQSSERVNLGEGSDSLITNCGEVARELN